MMKKNRWLAKTMLSLSLASFCSIGVAKTAKQDFLDEQSGIASYYSDKFHGRRTANGEIYDKSALTAAHATLPFGSLVHVVNLKNNRTVDVRITGRPHKSNTRILDLSKRAAKELGFLQAGITKVKISVLRIGEA
jgi:rare lipoprotein A